MGDGVFKEVFHLNVTQSKAVHSYKLNTDMQGLCSIHV